MKLEVPYYSQFIDVEDKFWMLRACGAVCFKMVVEYYGENIPDIVKFCNEAKENGGYDINNGWVHNYLVTKAEELGLQARRSEGLTSITDEIMASLDAGNPVIVSVEKRVLEQTRFHLIVLVGYEKGDEGDLTVVSESSSPYHLSPNTYFYYHEPESTDKTRGAYRICDVAIFKNYWRGKAIFISK